MVKWLKLTAQQGRQPVLIDVATVVGLRADGHSGTDVWASFVMTLGPHEWHVHERLEEVARMIDKLK